MCLTLVWSSASHLVSWVTPEYHWVYQKKKRQPWAREFTSKMQGSQQVADQLTYLQAFIISLVSNCAPQCSHTSFSWNLSWVLSALIGRSASQWYQINFISQYKSNCKFAWPASMNYFIITEIQHFQNLCLENVARWRPIMDWGRPINYDTVSSVRIV